MALSEAIPITTICDKPKTPAAAQPADGYRCAQPHPTKPLRPATSYKSPATAGSGGDFVWRGWRGGWGGLGFVGGVVEDFEEHAFQRHRRFYPQQVATGLVELGDEGWQRGLGQFAFELAPSRNGRASGVMAWSALKRTSR